MEKSTEPCQICGNNIKTSFVAICGDLRHSICAHCYNQSNGKCPSCRYICQEFTKLVIDEEECLPILDINKLILTLEGSRIHTALIKKTHTDSKELTEANIFDLARYFSRTTRDGQELINQPNPNFCGESIIDIKVYLSPGVKRTKVIKNISQKVTQQVFDIFQLFVYKNFDREKLANILSVSGDHCYNTKDFRGCFLLSTGSTKSSVSVFYQLDKEPTKQKIYGIVEQGQHRNINIYICESNIYNPLPVLRKITTEEREQFYERLNTDRIRGEGIGHPSCRLV